MATIDDDIAYLKDQIDKVMQRTPGKPDGRPEALSSGDLVRVREMRKERSALCRERWESITTPRQRLDYQREVGEIVRGINR